MNKSLILLYGSLIGTISGIIVYSILAPTKYFYVKFRLLSILLPFVFIFTFVIVLGGIILCFYKNSERKINKNAKINKNTYEILFIGVIVSIILLITFFWIDIYTRMKNIYLSIFPVLIPGLIMVIFSIYFKINPLRIKNIAIVMFAGFFLLVLGMCSSSFSVIFKFLTLIGQLLLLTGIIWSMGLITKRSRKKIEIFK